MVWDWNGTLLDDVSACVMALNRILAQRGLERMSVEDYRSEFDFPVKNFYAKLGLELRQDAWRALASEYHDFYNFYSARTPLRTGAVDILNHLNSLGIEMSVLSACERNILEKMLKQRGLRSYFRRVSGLHNLYAESKIDIGKELISDFRAPSSSIVLVGDTTHDFEVARALNCHCILVAGGHQSNNRLKECGCPLVAEPADIADLLS